MHHPEAAAYHHHYTALEAERTQAFAAFKEAYAMPLQGIFANCLVYACHAGEHIGKTAEANNLIKRLNLPLKAQATTFNAQNAFIIHFVEEYE